MMGKALLCGVKAGMDQETLSVTCYNQAGLPFHSK